MSYAENGSDEMRPRKYSESRSAQEEGQEKETLRNGLTGGERGRRWRRGSSRVVA